jgi:hypothetical protein
MKKETKERLKEYSTGLKTLQKVIKVLAENDIYFFGASISTTGISLHVESTAEIIKNLFNVTKTCQETKNLFYNYVIFEGIELKIII